MHCLRSALVSDLPVIYDMQNVPLREQILNSPLPPPGKFLAETSTQLGSTEFYYLHEDSDSPIGFIHIKKSEQSWEPTIWGKWLNTLVYGTMKTAFDHLKLPRLNWSVRKANHRAVQCYERHQFRITGTGNICNIQPGFEFIAIGPVVMFEITDSEFREREDYMIKSSLPVCFNW